MYVSNPLFGTDGIRGAVGTYPFTPEGIDHLATGLARWIIAQACSHPVLIIRDTRPSGPDICMSLARVLSAHHISVLDGGVAPTPAVIPLAQYYPYSYAIIISASHNPAGDNGIKLMHPQHGKLTARQEQAIEQTILHAIQEVKNQAAKVFYSSAQAIQKIDVQGIYLHTLQERYPMPDLTGKKIVLDGAHGAASHLALMLLTAAGAHVHHLDYPLEGARINDHCGATYPHKVQQAVISQQAYLGIAFDGDGDRLILVDSSGIIRTGDDIIALLLTHPEYAGSNPVIGTIMSNQALHDFAAGLGKTLVRTPVGDAHVATALVQHQAQIGGEPSGHIMLADAGPTGDALIALIRALQTLDYRQGIWPTYYPYPHQLYNIKVSAQVDLSQEPYHALLARAHAYIPQGRLIARYSGTEKMILRIMIEAPTQKEIQTCYDYLEKHFLILLRSGIT